MKKLLLVGGSGFVGSHVKGLLGSEYAAIVATGREIDVRDTGKLRELVFKEQPDSVIHLAAVTTLRESFDSPDETYDVIFRGTLNLLSALRDCGFGGRFLYVSSSEIYGRLADCDLPVTEERLTRPLSPYAVAKVASEALCYQWSQTAGFEIAIARPFNHIGPGQSERFAVAEFARQIAAIKLGLIEPELSVGDIDTTRDFTDARDVAYAYQRLLAQGGNGETYNVCSGKEYSMRFLIERMCSLGGVSASLKEDFARLRRSDQKRVLGSNAKLVADTGWMPRFTLDQTLSDILSFWVRKLAVERR